MLQKYTKPQTGSPPATYITPETLAILCWQSHRFLLAGQKVWKLILFKLLTDHQDRVMTALDEFITRAPWLKTFSGASHAILRKLFLQIQYVVAELLRSGHD